MMPPPNLLLFKKSWKNWGQLKRLLGNDDKTCKTIITSKIQIVQEEAKHDFFDKLTVKEISHISEQGLIGKLRLTQEEVNIALDSNNEAITKLDWLKALTSRNDVLSVSAKINAQLKTQKAVYKDLER